MSTSLCSPEGPAFTVTGRKTPSWLCKPFVLQGAGSSCISVFTHRSCSHNPTLGLWQEVRGAETNTAPWVHTQLRSAATLLEPPLFPWTLTHLTQREGKCSLMVKYHERRQCCLVYCTIDTEGHVFRNVCSADSDVKVKEIKWKTVSGMKIIRCASTELAHEISILSIPLYINKA